MEETEKTFISPQEATKYCDYPQEYLSLRVRKKNNSLFLKLALAPLTMFLFLGLFAAVNADAYNKKILDFVSSSSENISEFGIVVNNEVIAFNQNFDDGLVGIFSDVKIFFEKIVNETVDKPAENYQLASLSFSGDIFSSLTNLKNNFLDGYKFADICIEDGVTSLFIETNYNKICFVKIKPIALSADDTIDNVRQYWQWVFSRIYEKKDNFVDSVRGVDNYIEKKVAIAANNTLDLFEKYQSSLVKAFVSYGDGVVKSTKDVPQVVVQEFTKGEKEIIIRETFSGLSDKDLVALRNEFNLKIFDLSSQLSSQLGSQIQAIKVGGGQCETCKVSDQCKELIGGGTSCGTCGGTSGAGSSSGSSTITAGDTIFSVANGGTGKSSWTQYAIPYLSTAATFGEISIGTSDQCLKINATATGFAWGSCGGGWRRQQRYLV